MVVEEPTRGGTSTTPVVLTTVDTKLEKFADVCAEGACIVRCDPEVCMFCAFDIADGFKQRCAWVSGELAIAITYT